MYRILLIGSLTKASEGGQHWMALKQLGYNVDTVSDTPWHSPPGINTKLSLIERASRKLLLRPKDSSRLNQRVLEKCRLFKPDIIWVVKSLVLKPSTIQAAKQILPNSQWLWFSGDDMFMRHNQSCYFKRSLPLYDHVFTTKSYNCNTDELPALGARNVHFIHKSYNPEIHFPQQVTQTEQKQLGADVSFVGTFENERAYQMLKLAQRGVKIRVWGDGWQQWQNAHANLHIENRPIYCADYRKNVCASRISLCFLRKLNRDLHTNRSVEIPAMGGFMLAERTIEHQKLFQEDVEAVYFDSQDNDELYEKVCYYLAHDEKRRHIARNARQRCLNSGYSGPDSVAHMLKLIGARP